MAISNRERVGRALDTLRPELAKYVEQELRDVYAEKWEDHLATGHEAATGPLLDNQRLVNTMIAEWDDVFDQVLNKGAKNLAHNIRKWRNKHAHEEPFDLNDTLSSLIAVQKMLEAIQSPAAEEVERSKLDLMRRQFETESKKEEKRAANPPIAGLESAGLRPWREVIAPHPDVAWGTFQTTTRNRM